MAAEDTHFYQSAIINISNLKLKGFKSHLIIRKYFMEKPLVDKVKYNQCFV